jgi:hypothetical protein
LYGFVSFVTIVHGWTWDVSFFFPSEIVPSVYISMRGTVDVVPLATVVKDEEKNRGGPIRKVCRLQSAADGFLLSSGNCYKNIQAA